MRNGREFRQGFGGMRWAAIFLMVLMPFPTASAGEYWSGTPVQPGTGHPAEPLGQGFYLIDADGNPLSTDNTLYVDDTISSNDIDGNVYGGAGFGSTSVTGSRVVFRYVNGMSIAVYDAGGTPPDAESGTVFGGYGENGDVGQNSVHFANSCDSYIMGSVYGGAATGYGTVRDNEVAVERGSNANVGESVGGGMSTNGAVRDNTVRMSGGEVVGNSGSGAVWGGLALGNGEVAGNKVFLEYDAVVGVDVYGGYNAAASGPNTAAVSNNAVTVATDTTVSGSIAGGMSESNGDVYANAVSFEKGVVNGPIYGGRSNGVGQVSRNSVAMRGGIAKDEIFGGYATDGDAVHNEVVFSGGEARENIYGGWSDVGAASGNSVVLDGGSVGKSVYGGHGDTSTGNRVTVRNGVAFLGGSSLMGGNQSDFSGNVLDTSGHGYSPDAVGNFATYNFSLSRDDVGETVYTTTQPVDVGGASVNVVFDNQGAPMGIGDEITLFSQTTGSAASLADATAANGALFDHDVVLAGEAATGLLLRVAGTRASQETRLLGMAQLSGMHMVNLAHDLQRGIADLAAASELGRNRPAIFAAFAGGSSKWNAGGDSRLSIAHASLITGVGHRLGDVLLAGYLEAGWGRYDGREHGRLYNNNDAVGYYGGGVLARYEADGFYGEGSFHAGSAKSEFDGVVRGTRVDCDYRAAYYGLGAAFGYRQDIAGSHLDLSLAYSWNRLNGDTLRVASNQVALNSVASHRLRAGGRWTAASTEVFAPYAGLAGEYELDGKSSGRVRDYALVGAGTGGFTGIGEAGLRFADVASRYSADLGIEGYFGKRTGVAARAIFGVVF